MESNAFIYLLTAIILLVDVESISIDPHFIMKRNTIRPTLTVDIGPQSSSVPSVLNQDSISDYYFPVDGQLFNFSCVIKQPSYRFKIALLREQELNNGEKKGPIDLTDPTDMTQVNPSLSESNRLEIKFDEFNAPDKDKPDEQVKYLRASFLAKDLKIKDSGIYKCMYSNMSKQIKVVMFKLAHSDNIKFPRVPFKSVEINKPIELTCDVNDVYPKPLITFLSPTNQVIENDLIQVTDTSVKNEVIYAFSSSNKLTYTPKYTDNNRNITCSVFSFGSNNVTIATSYKLNIVGVETVAEDCKENQYADINDQNYQITCVYFSNPRLDPIWETKIVKKSSVVVGSTTAIETGIEAGGGGGGGGESSTTPPSITQDVEELFTIPTESDETSNYIASLVEVGEPGSGVFKATVTIKNVREEDFKNYTMKLGSNEFQLKLRKKSEYIKEQILNPGSPIGSGAGRQTVFEIHSILIMIFQSALFTIFYFKR